MSLSEDKVMHWLLIDGSPIHFTTKCFTHRISRQESQSVLEIINENARGKKHNKNEIFDLNISK